MMYGAVPPGTDSRADQKVVESKGVRVEGAGESGEGEVGSGPSVISGG